MAEACIGNSRALALWERLVLDGQRIAAVTGKDLHSMPRDAEDLMRKYLSMKAPLRWA